MSQQNMNSEEMSNLQNELKFLEKGLIRYLQSICNGFELQHREDGEFKNVETVLKVRDKIFPYTYQGENYPVALIDLERYPVDTNAYRHLMVALASKKIYFLYGLFGLATENNPAQLNTMVVLLSDHLISPEENVKMVEDFMAEFEIGMLKRIHGLK